ncbi:MAG: dehypoxanthine futalosine cyclase [Verrucomicrobiae bacterium]|nr:dehypoxanthine futalosine cyclase [Verrucomicrobiae bacterium]
MRKPLSHPSQDIPAGKILSGRRLQPDAALRLFRECPLETLGALAHETRMRKTASAYNGCGGKIVTYAVDRNINYTNVCSVRCGFCAFSRDEHSPDAYLIDFKTLDAKLAELTSLGGTQVLLQGGHHPKLGLDYCLNLVGHIRKKFPHLNIHGFSAPEIHDLCQKTGLPCRAVLSRLKDAGLGSLPGGGAEILCDRVRRRLSPKKCSTARWLDIMRAAHEIGLRSSATMMYGHIETPEERIRHLDRLRRLQDETRGFTAFIAWPFQPGNTVFDGKIEPSGAVDYLRTQALSRLYLDNFDNLQASWVTQGPQIGQLALLYGANDLGSLMIEENVVAAAGTRHRMNLEEMRRLISDLGFKPRQRDTWYRLISKAR